MPSCSLRLVARLAFGLVNNHPFVDGNKRVGVLAMLVTLLSNGVSVAATNDDVIELGFGLADGSLDTDAVIGWIREHSRQG
jgi:death-on-curing protein